MGSGHYNQKGHFFPGFLMFVVVMVLEKGEGGGKGRKISSPRQGIEPGTSRLHGGCSN